MTTHTSAAAPATAWVQVHPGLYLIPGHHPASMWSDANVPNIAVLHAGRELYLLDSGLGPVQRQAVLDLAEHLAGQYDTVTLLNSHGHVDHMGNNDVLQAVPATGRRHLVSRRSLPYLDPMGHFRDAYNVGDRYFDYCTGLRLDVQDLLPLLQRVGAPHDLDPEVLTGLARELSASGLTAVLSHVMGDLLVRMISETYPPIHMDVSHAEHYESQPRETFRYGEAEWTGWRVGEVCVFEAGGHSPDGMVFYLPHQRFLFLADETTTIPIWSETDPEAAERNLRRVLAMVETGAVTAVAAGHFPLEVLTGAEDITRTLQAFLAQKHAFETTVQSAVAAFPDGVSIDDLYAHLSRYGDQLVQAMLGMQFPKMPTFFKLTLLNHCRRHLTQRPGATGKPVFTLAR